MKKKTEVTAFNQDNLRLLEEHCAAMDEGDTPRVLETCNELFLRDVDSDNVGDKTVTYLLSIGETDKARNLLKPAQTCVRELLKTEIDAGRPVTWQNNPYSWVGPKLMLFRFDGSTQANAAPRALLSS